VALRKGLATLRIAGAVAVLALAAVGSVGTWRWARGIVSPPPAPPPELARDVTPVARVAADVPTLAAPLDERTAAKYAIPPHTAAPPPADAARTPPAGRFFAGAIAGGSRGGVRAEVEAGPGPRGDTFDAICYVPAAGEPAEIRVVWTTPPASLAEHAGCAAAQGAQATADAAKAAGEAVARRLGHELRLSLRGGPGYGLGGPGLLGLASIEGRTKRGRSYAVDGVAWLSSKPAFAAAATWGLERRLLGGDDG
jgi:hypothetical protein